MSQPLWVKGFTMSRMTLLKGEVWLGDGVSDRALLRFGKSPEAGYPPYNIELLGSAEAESEALRITLAVAGFSLQELAITLEAGALVVRGQQNEEREREFIYRGIAARRFKRTFALANGVEVRKAELHNGLLAIELERPHGSQRVRTVPIANADKTANTTRPLARANETVSDAE
jgi:HSP20 family molecular chaperone IbpA